MIWGHVFSVGTGEMFKVDSRIYGAKYNVVQWKNLFEAG